MEDKIREAVGLLRHRIISPVLMDSGRSQMEYFRNIEKQDFDVPGQGLKRFRASTMKGWLNRYKRDGFRALMPKPRGDAGGYRKCSDSMRENIRKLRQDNISLSVIKFYDKCIEEKILGMPPLCLATVRRFLKQENLYPEKNLKARKRYEMARFGQLWIGDYMHGPRVLSGSSGKRKKAILMAIIDDHSRMIVEAQFGFGENTLLLETVFKEAILKFGLPERLYVDNGPSFSSQYLARVCANLEIGLVHSKPYDSPSRGKIERFFRTVRSSFLSIWDEASQQLTLENLNDLFSKWLRDEYHHKHHQGIDMRPVDRYQTSLAYYPLRRVDEETLEEFFLVSDERTVNRDSTIKYNGHVYEVPSQLTGRRIEIRYNQENPSDVYYYENGIRQQKLHVVDAYANAREYRPSERESHISLQGAQ